MELNIAVGSYPTTTPLLEGLCSSSDLNLTFADTQGSIVNAFRKMCRDFAYDACEMGITTYFSALQYGLPFVGIPVFPLHDFAFRTIMVNRASGIVTPKHLEGRRIAVRTYTVTGPVWCRGMLADLFDVDLDSLTWVINDREHVAEFEWPSNVEFLEGADLAAMLDRGEVDAGIGIHPGNGETVVPLFADPAAIIERWYAATGIVPIHHLLVVQERILKDAPEVLPELSRVFTEARELGLKRLDPADSSDPQAKLINDRASVLGPDVDPAPYGIEANRRALETILRYSQEQAILTKDAKLSEVIVEGS